MSSCITRIHYSFIICIIIIHSPFLSSLLSLPLLQLCPPLSSPNIFICKGAYHCIESLYSSATNSQPEDKLTELYSSCPLLHLLDHLTTCKVSLVTDPIGLQLVLQSLYSSTGHGNKRGTFPWLAPPNALQSAKKRHGKKAGSLDEGERVRVVIVESLLLMMVGLERGPLYMINQLLSILSGVDIKVRNTCTCTCNDCTCTCTCIAFYTIFTISTLYSLPFSSSVS